MFELRVSEEKIWRLLNAQGIVISAGQISNILIKKHLAQFAAERQAILAVGVKTTRYQYMDDTSSIDRCDGSRKMRRGVGGD